MGFEESCNKMQTAVGSGGGCLIYVGRSPDETNFTWGVLQMQISAPQPVKIQSRVS